MQYYMFDDLVSESEKAIKANIPKKRSSVEKKIRKMEKLLFRYNKELSDMMMMSRLEWGYHKLNIGKILIRLRDYVQSIGWNWTQYLSQKNINISNAVIKKYMTLASIPGSEKYMNYGIDRIYRIVNRKNVRIHNLETWMTNRGFPVFDNQDLLDDPSLRTELSKYRKEIDEKLGIKHRCCKNCFNFNHKGNYCTAIVTAMHNNYNQNNPVYLMPKQGTQARLKIQNENNFSCSLYNKDVTQIKF